MSYKNIQYGRKNVRRNYGQVQTNVELPNLIEVQTKSFEWLKGEGLDKLFKEISPILDYSDGEKYEFNFLSHEFDEPKYTIAEAKIHDSNYSRPLYCNVSLENKETGEIKEDRVFMGDIPMMTPTGTFVIHGSEKVVVTQIVRSAGVFYSSEKDKKTGEYIYSGQIIPTRGLWIEYEMGGKDKKPVWYAKVDRTRKIFLTTFLSALGLSKSAMLDLLFGERKCDKKTGEVIYDVPNSLYSIFENTLSKDQIWFKPDETIKALYECIRPGDRTTPESARKYIQSHFFDSRRYDLADVGRYKINEKLDVLKRAAERNYRLAYDLVDPETGEVILFEGDEIGVNASVNHGNGPEIINTLAILEEHRELLRKTYTFDVPVDTPEISVDVLDVLVHTTEGDVIVRLVGNDQREKVNHVVLSDIFASVSYFLNLQVGVGRIDDIDHLGNRRLRLIGEQLQNRFRIGLLKLEKSIKEKMAISSDVKIVTPQTLLNNCRYFYSPVLEFFNTDQLSQFMDQINPLSELTHKRRLSALGQGGISRDRATIEVRDVHPSHYGRICPVETPEGQNIGLINSLATYAKANKFGFIQTPYLKVKNNLNDEDYKAGKVPLKVWIDSKEPEYLNAYEEEKYYIAEGNVKMEKDPENPGEILINEKTVMARHNLEFAEVERELLNYVDVSPKQVVACGTACIPFLEHDDTTRALMGANMQRQAIPLLKPEAPIVGTGIEYKVAHDSGVALISDCNGTVSYVDGTLIKVIDEDGKERCYELNKYERSNMSTCVNQRPIVEIGEKVKVGDILADGQSMQQGELALGRNVVIAFMTWNGYNFEDAVIMSERMVQDDVYTSIHIECYTCEVRESKLGKEMITRDLEGEAKDSIQYLDENGIILLGAEVKEGDTLVGKITPKGVTEPTGEERLTLALLGDNSKDFKVSSLKVPHGGGGIVCKIEHFHRDANTILSAGVNEIVRVFIVQKRKISEGDKMSGRHGNKGVISNIVPIEDMPYMADGTPVDIMLNPQGVPSRMNIGQVLEVHLGMAAKKLGVKVATPVFDGVTKEDLKEIMEEARQKDINANINDPKHAEAIIDENGKTYLYDGRTGRQFDHKICVGVMYMIKLAHMVDDKLHARSEGPYTLVTQQPMGGKAQNGGQRFGEMEVWALEAYGAAYTLQEMMTIKSDDIIGRNKVYKAIVDGEPLPESGVPEAFRTMIRELQGLGLSVRLVDQNNKNVVNDSIINELVAATDSKRGL